MRPGAEPPEPRRRRRSGAAAAAAHRAPARQRPQPAPQRSAIDERSLLRRRDGDAALLDHEVCSLRLLAEPEIEPIRKLRRPHRPESVRERDVRCFTDPDMPQEPLGEARVEGHVERRDRAAGELRAPARSPPLLTTRTDHTGSSGRHVHRRPGAPRPLPRIASSHRRRPRRLSSLPGAAPRSRSATTPTTAPATSTAATAT